MAENKYLTVTDLNYYNLRKNLKMTVLAQGIFARGII